MNKAKCIDGKCNNCEHCKELDIKERIKNSWMDVELFRIVKGRLPSQAGDRLTKKDAKNYIDRFAFGSEKYPKSNVKKESMDRFAFHVYSPTNLAYGEG
jgi:hypothetical protein